MKLHASKVSIPENETHYRYSDYHYEDGLRIKLSKFYSVKETACFHYIVDEWEFSRLKRCDLEGMASLDQSFTVRRVGKHALRSYCYQSKALALNSFIKRKEKQLFHAETATSKATLALRKVCGISADDIGDSVNCGLDDHLQTFIFD